jgi:hypothetical protein
LTLSRHKRQEKGFYDMDNKLTPKQKIAIEALVLSGDKTQAAAAAGISRPTIYKWYALPHFREALNKAVGEMLSSLAGKLVSQSLNAADVLVEVMNDTEAASSVRVRAADILLSRMLQLHEVIDLEERVSRLETVNNVKSK